ncbi:MAG: hypothetical protein WC217_01930 [Candidatus Paceibacterota bacterium]|jgi:hypothetical protein
MKKEISAQKGATPTQKTVLKIGAGLLAAGTAAAAAGYYFYGSAKAKSHRKIAAKWATAMKNEVIRETKRLEKVSPKAFAAVVDRVAKTYQSVRSVDVEEVKRAAKELKANWDVIRSETRRTAKKAVARAKKATTKRA